MKKLLYRIILGSLLFNCTLVHAQIPSGATWDLRKEENGIQVFTANAGSGGRKYIKVSAVLAGSLDKVEAIFRDIPRQKNWVYGTRQSSLVQKMGNDQLLYYNETNLPWPVSNRDIAIFMKLKEDPSRHTLTVQQEGRPAAVPVHKGIVRVPHLEGTWQFHEEGKGQLKTEYLLDIDPGGSLPTWLVNMFITKGPYKTFVNLQKQLSH